MHGTDAFRSIGLSWHLHFWSGWPCKNLKLNDWLYTQTWGYHSKFSLNKLTQWQFLSWCGHIQPLLQRWSSWDHGCGSRQAPSIALLALQCCESALTAKELVPAQTSPKGTYLFFCWNVNIFSGIQPERVQLYLDSVSSTECEKDADWLCSVAQTPWHCKLVAVRL